MQESGFFLISFFVQMKSVEEQGENKRGKGKPEGGKIFIHN